MVPPQLALMANQQGPIQTVFDYDLRRFDRLIDMIQLAVMGHGPVTTHEAGGLQAQDRLEPASGRPRPMHIGCLYESAVHRGHLYRGENGHNHYGTT